MSALPPARIAPMQPIVSLTTAQTLQTPRTAVPLASTGTIGGSIQIHQVFASSPAPKAFSTTMSRFDAMHAMLNARIASDRLIRSVMSVKQEANSPTAPVIIILVRMASTSTPPVSPVLTHAHNAPIQLTAPSALTTSL